MPRIYTGADVLVRHVAPIPVAIMEHRGDPAMIGGTVQRFIAWRRALGLDPGRSRTFNIFYTDPRTTSPDQYRLGLCASTENLAGPVGDGAVAGLIPGGRRAVIRIVGEQDMLEHAAMYLYRDWLPASGEQAGEFPPYCQRVSFFPQVAACDAVTEFFLPLKQRACP